MFRIKICGITSVEDAVAVEQAGADAIGLNFYPKSKRCVSIEQALEIRSAVSDKVQIVGLFVNMLPADIELIHDQVNFDWVQLHGDESAVDVKCLKKFTTCNVMRAFRSKDDWEVEIGKFLHFCELNLTAPDAVLIDGYKEGEYGGTGDVADWGSIKRWTRKLEIPNLVLAGGLTPVNVAEAIEFVSPVAVDTASGVESSPGVKDHQLVHEFVENAAKSFDKM
ncbi:MAG: N-(5'-phosphoribosyl)anthranilate isomerase [Blastopirellula sp.]|nr:MAG: N-(5'-phosphoribosyl)anthranilate isomerase [Blastopirellula sp.]